MANEAEEKFEIVDSSEELEEEELLNENVEKEVVQDLIDAGN